MSGEMKINEGDAVIVEPRGAIGIAVSILPYNEYDNDIDDDMSYLFHIKTIEEWKNYWKKCYNIDLKDFNKVVKVIFVGMDHTFDYPITTIRKVIHFKKFTKIHRWKLNYNIDYIPIYYIYSRIKIYVYKIKENRMIKKHYKEMYGL